MKKLIKSEKGMSLIEVILALAILSVVTIPIFIGFMNALIISKRVDVQTNVNAVTRIIKEEVKNALLDENLHLYSIDNSEVKIIYHIKNAAEVGGVYDNELFRLKDLTEDDSEENYFRRRFFYEIIYDHEQCYDEDYPFVYHVIISVGLLDSNVNINDHVAIVEAINNDKYKNVNLFKMGVNMGEQIH
ncbi:UNVERIFIED_CONTAM: prepilin-type N-terminal cleavage/methylation domain-containing protein [Acetivibrio alkalicellulosi]